MLAVTKKQGELASAANGQVATLGAETPYTAVVAALPAEQDLPLELLWRRLLRQKWPLLSILLSVLLLSALITWATPPSYRAMATLQIEKQGVQVVNFGSVTAPSPDLGEQDPFFRTQYEQLKSRKLAEQVITALDLRQRLFEGPQPSNWLSSAAQSLKAMGASLFPSKGQQGGQAQPVDYTKLFAERLYVEPVEKTHLVKVFFESPDPVLSAEVVNALVDAFIKDSISAQSATDSYAKQFLEQELEKARQRLTEQEARLVAYAKRNNILEVNNSQSSQERKLDDLYAALGQAERSRIQVESRMLQGRAHGNVSEVLNNPVIEGLKKELVTLEAELREKLKLFKADYPDVQQLQGRITEVRTQLQQETAKLQQALQAEYTAAQKLEDDLRNQLATYKSELGKLRDNSIEYNALKREVETSRSLYDSLLQRVKEVGVASNANTSNIRVIEQAKPDYRVFRPKKALNLLLGGLVGLLLGVGAALLRETLGHRITSAAELQQLTGLPVLGSIPHVRHKSENQLALAAVRDVGSSHAEAYRIAAANLHFLLPGGKTPRVTLLTSVHPAEGKSTSAVNLAVSQAQRQMKVLLIDADLRRPSLHTKLGIPQARGLSNFLAGEVDIAAVTHASREVKGLYFITAGTRILDPVQALSSPVMARFLTLAAKHFDSAIIDAAPAALFADALYLAAMAETTLLVVDEGRIHRRRLLQVLGQLRRVRANLAGFLMVKAHAKAGDYGCYGRYQKQLAKAGRPAADTAAGRKKNRKGLNLAPAL